MVAILKELIFETIRTGCTGRWGLGVTILIFLIAHNETTGPTAVCSTFFAALYGLFSAICKSELKHLQIPYIRASNKFDFLCLFLAFWMDALALLAACGAIARTLSTCLDAMTGGLARILILGRNSPANEPWPDVLGVVVVFLVSGMFMLGLENTKTFSFLMSIAMLGLSAILTTVSWFQGSTEDWNNGFFQPNGFSSFLTASALGAFGYPNELPSAKGWKKIIGPLLTVAVLTSTVLTAGCLSTITHYNPARDYAAVPIFGILETNHFEKLIPAAACLLVLSSSGAFLELFPELYNIIVKFATSDWKILARQISYESPDSGSPILAIFIAGSLTAMLAFACPLQILTYILAGGHFCSNLIRAFYLLYSPHRPKYIQQSADVNQTYSRLSTDPKDQTASSSSRRSLWNLNKPIRDAIKSRAKKKTKSNSEVEKEWLLLGEPSSPHPVRESELNTESAILSEVDPGIVDFDFNNKLENTDSDISTDIDAVVDEYRQKVKVTMAGPMEKTIRVPTLGSWRLTCLAILFIILAIISTVFGIFFQIQAITITGFAVIFTVSITMSFIPKYSGIATNLSPLITTCSLLLGSILLSACIRESWPAIIFWMLAGLVIFIRCDAWCCLCVSHGAPIVSNVSGKTATIKIPRPPSTFVITGRVQSTR